DDTRQLHAVDQKYRQRVLALTNSVEEEVLQILGTFRHFCFSSPASPAVAQHYPALSSAMTALPPRGRHADTYEPAASGKWLTGRAFFRNVKKRAPERQGYGARMSVGHRAAVDFHHGHDHGGGGGDEGFARRLSFFHREGPLLDLQAQPGSNIHNGRARDPAQNAVVGGPGHQLAVLRDDPGVRGRALLHKSFGIDEPGFGGTALARLLPRKHVGQQADRLDVHPLPPVLGHRDHLHAGLRAPGVGLRIGPLRRNDERGAGTLRRKHMIARRHATRHLHIDEAVSHAIAARYLAHDQFQSRAAQRPADTQLPQGSVESVEMPRHIDDEAARHLAHLIDAIGELVPPVLDMYGGLSVTDITAVHI